MSLKRLSLLASIFMVLSMLLAACGADPTATAVPQPTATTAPVAVDTATTAPAAADTATTAPAAADTATTAPATGATATTAPATGDTSALASRDWSKVGPELVNAMKGQYKGTKVSMYGPFTGDDEAKFNDSLKEYEAATGIDIQYEGTKEFETSINVRVQGGNAPDITDFPQPGLLASIATSGKVLDVNKLINPAWLKQNYNQGYLDTATVSDGKGGTILDGIFQRVNAKGLVYYPKKAFDADGYKVPTTWAEFEALQNQIIADGDTPWCLGIESGSATGWPATDWVENLMLRTTSPENYDKWVSGELPFTDPIVKNAASIMQKIWFDPKMVYGGTKTILSTNFGDAPKPMLQDPPKCWFVEQGNFITSYFSTINPSAQPGVDYDFFYLPSVDASLGRPMEFGGDLFAAFNDRPEVRATLQFFSTFAGIEGWVKAGGALAPQKDADPNAYTNAQDRKVADTLLAATVVRFDASDLMPGAVGAGTFWKGMTDLVAGTVDLDGALAEAQQGWANVKK